MASLMRALAPEAFGFRQFIPSNWSADFRLHFGGTSAVADVGVRWPSGQQLEIDMRPGPLRMICLFPQQSVEKRLSRRLLASAMRLDGHKDCIDFSQLPWVVQAKHPAAIGLTIHVQYAKVHRMRFPI